MARIPLFRTDELVHEHNWKKNQRARKWAGKGTEPLPADGPLMACFSSPSPHQAHSAPAEDDMLRLSQGLLSRRGQ